MSFENAISIGLRSCEYGGKNKNQTPRSLDTSAARALFRDHAKRDPNNFSRQEAGQAKREKVDPKALKTMFRRCWDHSDSRSAFAAALWEEGYILARGDRRGFVAVDTNGKIWSLSRWCGVKPKGLRARLGSEDKLWSVEEARSAFADLTARGSQNGNTQSDPEFEQRRDALVRQQRRERADLRASQEARRLAELKARQARLPKGLKAAWAKITDRYQLLVVELERDAAAAQERDRQEFQALIDRHLAERRDLERLRNQPDFLHDLNEAFETAIRVDPRQNLVLPPDDIPFSEKQLIKTPDLILDHISHKKSQFSRTDVLRALAKRIRDPMALNPEQEGWRS